MLRSVALSNASILIERCSRFRMADELPGNLNSSDHRRTETANADQPLELYRFLRDDLRTKFIQFIPIVEWTTPELINIANQGWDEKVKDRPLYVQAGNQVTDHSVKSEQWGRFLIAIFDEWEVPACQK